MSRGSGLVPLRIRILVALEANPDGLLAYALGRDLGASSGTLYPALARLVGGGLLDLREGTPVVRGKKVEDRTFYVLSEAGRAQLDEIRSQVAPASARAHGFNPGVNAI
jgi:DNA-binding MarR family transcriptional regulator